MPDERTYGFNVDDATALLQSISTEQIPYQETRPRSGYVVRSAVLNEDITAPSSSLVTMTTAESYFLELQDDGTSELSDDPFDASNNDPYFTGERGTLITVAWRDGIWLIIDAACSPQDALITALDAL